MDQRSQLVVHDIEEVLLFEDPPPNNNNSGVDAEEEFLYSSGPSGVTSSANPIPNYGQFDVAIPVDDDGYDEEFIDWGTGPANPVVPAFDTDDEEDVVIAAVITETERIGRRLNRLLAPIEDLGLKNPTRREITNLRLPQPLVTYRQRPAFEISGKLEFSSTAFERLKDGQFIYVPQEYQMKKKIKGVTIHWTDGTDSSPEIPKECRIYDIRESAEVFIERKDLDKYWCICCMAVDQ